MHTRHHNATPRLRDSATSLLMLVSAACAIASFLLAFVPVARAIDYVNNPPNHTTYLDGCTAADRNIFSTNCDFTPTGWITGTAPNVTCYQGASIPSCAADKVYNCDAAACSCAPTQINCGGTCQNPINVSCGPGQTVDRCNGTCVGPQYVLADSDPVSMQQGDAQISGTMYADGGFCIGAFCLTDWPNYWWVAANADDIFSGNVGDVGIGNTTPDAKLSVAEVTGANPLITAYQDADLRFRVNNDGGTLIATGGNTNTTADLTVRGRGTGAGTLIGAYDGPSDLFVVKANGEIGVGSAVTGKTIDVSTVFPIMRLRNSTAANEWNGVSYARNGVEEDWFVGMGDNATHGDSLLFRSNAGTGYNGTNRMTIDQTGNVTVASDATPGTLRVYGAFMVGNAATSATGTLASAIGLGAVASGPNAVAIGRNAAATGNGSVVIGTGVAAGQLMTSAANASLAVGFNSTVPTVFVSTAPGAGFSGNVGIGTGTGTPPARLTVANPSGQALGGDYFAVYNTDPAQVPDEIKYLSVNSVGRVSVTDNATPSGVNGLMTIEKTMSSAQNFFKVKRGDGSDVFTIEGKDGAAPTDPDGNVGIGKVNDDPGFILDVADDLPIMRLNDLNNTDKTLTEPDYHGIRLDKNWNEQWFMGTTDGNGGVPASTFVLRSTQPDGGGGTITKNVMTIDLDGNVTFLTATQTAGGCFGPTVVGLTAPIATGGNVGSSGGVSGYRRADDICALAHNGAHVCRVDEVLESIQCDDAFVTNAANNDLDAWINDGPPGYTEPANDCFGWTNNAPSSLGRKWRFDAVSGGQGRLSTCNQTNIPFACCR